MESPHIQINHEDEVLQLSPKLPNSDLFEYENWRNKGKVKPEESSILIVVSERMKRPLEIKDRKPSKYFRPCPEIKIKQKVATNAKLVQAKNKLLFNGNNFFQPIIVNEKKFMLKNTCAFDSIVQILATVAFDSPRYLKHIEESDNDTFGFILVFLESGAVNHVYGLRCLLLKDYNCQENEKNNFGETQMKTSPCMLRSIDVYTNITEIWNFLMNKQPSLFYTLQP